MSHCTWQGQWVIWMREEFAEMKRLMFVKSKVFTSAKPWWTVKPGKSWSKCRQTQNQAHFPRMTSLRNNLNITGPMCSMIQCMCFDSCSGSIQSPARHMTCSDVQSAHAPRHYNIHINHPTTEVTLLKQQQTPDSRLTLYWLTGVSKTCKCAFNEIAKYSDGKRFWRYTGPQPKALLLIFNK